MIAPGTWLKWYVTDARRLPIYFRFIGRILVGQDQFESIIIDTQWCQRINVNEEFLHWLLPLEEGDKPSFIVKRVIADHVNGELRHKGGGEKQALPFAAAASASADQATFPRLFRTV